LVEKARVLAEKKAQDSDYEDDEEEEEPEGEGEMDGEEAILTKHKSSLWQHVESFQFQLQQLILILLIDPLPAQYSHSLCTSLAEALSDMDTFKATSLEAAGLKGDLIISPISSPFTTQEGEETWQNILNLRQPPAAAVSGKKPPAPKPQKGYATDEQRKKYYLSFYESLSNALLEGILHGLTEIDFMMNQIHEQKQINSSSSYATLTQISSFRQEDIQPSVALTPPVTPLPATATTTPPPIFFTFNGDAFGSFSGSAFDLQTSLKYESLSPLLPLIEYGAETIILLFETDKKSPQEVSSSGDPSFPEIANEITAIISQQWNEKKVPKKQQHQKVNLSLQTKYLATMAELNLFLDNQNKITMMSKSPREGEAAAGAVGGGGVRNVTILLLENLLSPTLLPKTPEYVEEMSDDEEDAIPIGLKEFKEEKFKAWKSLEPRNLPVSIEVMGHPHTVNCFTDGAAALDRLVSEYHGIVIEGDSRSLFPSPNGVLTNWNFSNTLVSPQIREMMVWLGVVSHFPLIPSIRSETDKTAAASGAASELLPFGDYLSFLFPTSTTPQPTLVITIGGRLTTEKIRFLEYAIDLVSPVRLLFHFLLNSSLLLLLLLLVLLPVLVRVRGIQLSSWVSSVSLFYWQQGLCF
jgi:hypothetical protein